MKWKVTSMVLVVAVLGAFLVAPVAARAQETQTIDPIPVSASKNGGTKNFTGEWTITRFVEDGGTIFAEGVLSGQVTNKKGKVTHNVEETVLLPVAVTSESTANTAAVRAQLQPVCDVLFLQLGPITLNLLGLNLQIGGGPEGDLPIVVEITADAAGGLLGGLLCALAGGIPLDLSQLIQVLELLNQLFGLLGYAEQPFRLIQAPGPGAGAIAPAPIVSGGSSSGQVADQPQSFCE
jgi:hypothetical protein